MGTGKTTVGRAVAHRIGFKCVDSDHEIERKAGKPVAEIFAQDGEGAFRALERWFVEEGHARERLVVACGGGLVVQPGMLDLLGERGVVVCLHASIETILARTARHSKTRPLLNVEDPDARARALYAEREAVYKTAGTVILTDSRPLAEITAHVVRVWRRESEAFARRSAARGS
ncbi:MAG TPA: shikimate kinase [Opitutaceae bacterium]|nr:shikimate kinase [Opitutaceae bacterium]